MNNSSVVLVLLILIATVSCSHQVTRQSVSEIERPLYLPKRNWQISLGGGVGHYKFPWMDKWADSRLLIYSDDETIWFPLVTLKWPSIHIGEKYEWNVPASFRWYLKKNMETKNGISRITGINLALVNEVTGLSYSWYKGVTYYTQHVIELKTILSKKIWFESNSGISLVLPTRKPWKVYFEALLQVPLSIGYQITKKWSCLGTFALLGYYTHDGPFYKDYQSEIISHNKSWARAINWFDLDLKIPLQTMYVFNQQWEVAFMIEGDIHTQNEVAATSSMWFTFTW